MLLLRISDRAVECCGFPGDFRHRSVRDRRPNHRLRWIHVSRIRVSIVGALKDDRGAGGFADKAGTRAWRLRCLMSRDLTLYSWAELRPRSFFLRLGGLWLVTFTVLGAPIAAASFNPSKDPLKFILAAGIGTLLLVSLVVLRIYLGWSYVGDRLLSAVIPYEETGWYDGQMWVKPPEVLARDRLLGSYKVKPVINMLKQTLVGTGVLLVSAVSLFIFAAPVEEIIHSVLEPKDNNVTAPTSKSKPNLRKEELLRLPAEVMKDDDLAAAAAEAADGRPVYCRDRFYRALAGGQYCRWDDLLN
uniref:Uncharacterized protein n=1 Tax=Ananas comosus var. bracteatus TaxID=296719 RepID=A0A6V7PNF8_ANACO|nr:unnamed protein product [Ananas comosus var. bracteatus]